MTQVAPTGATASTEAASTGSLPLADSPLGPDDRHDRDRHLERLVRGRRARVRDLLRRGRARRPIRRSSHDVWKTEPAHWRGRVRTSPESEPTDRGRPGLGRRRGDVDSRRRSCSSRPSAPRRPAGPPLDADGPDALPRRRPDGRPGLSTSRARAEHHRQVPRDPVGIAAMEEATYRGVSVNATVSFSSRRPSPPARRSSAACGGARPRGCRSTRWGRSSP